MAPIIISDAPMTSAKLCHAFGRSSRCCTVNDVLSFETACTALEAGHLAPDLIVLVLRDELDEAIEQLSRLARISSARKIVVGTMEDPHRILESLHAGADDYLDEHGDLAAQLESALKRCKPTSAAPAVHGRLIAVTSVCGGCGGSIIAENVAAVISNRFGSCGLLDFDIEKGDQATLLNVTPRHSVADLCHKQDTLDENMLKQSFCSHDCGVQLLAAPNGRAEIQQVNAQGLAKVLEVARSTMPFVVVDYPEFREHPGVEMLGAADVVLSVFRMDFIALRNLHRRLEAWDELAIQPKSVRLVANRCGQQKELSAGMIESALSKKIDAFVPEDAAQVNLSVNCGIPVVVEAPKSTFSQAINQLVDGLGLGGAQKLAPPNKIGGFLHSLCSKSALIRLGAAAPEVA